MIQHSTLSAPAALGSSGMSRTFAREMRGTAIIEYRSFLASAANRFSEEDIEGLADYLSELPRSGKETTQLKGLRLLNWPLKDLGRDPKATIGYYFRNEREPLHLISCLRLDLKDAANETLALAFSEMAQAPK